MPNGAQRRIVETPANDRAQSLNERAIKNASNCKMVRERLRFLTREVRYFPSLRQFLDELSDFHHRVIDGAQRARLGIHSGDIALNDNGLSKFLSGDDSKINAADFRIVVHFLHEQHVLSPDNQGALIASQFRDPLFHVLLHFLGVNDATLDAAKAVLPGLYRAWRPSSSFPGRYWAGSLKIWIDPESGALKTHEDYAAGPTDGRRNRRISFDGYIVANGHQYTYVSHNQNNTSLQMAILPQVSKLGARITTMSGLVTDMTTGHLYSARVLYDLAYSPDEITDAIEDATYAALDLIDAEDIPDSIRSFFEPRPMHGITLF